MRYSSVIKDSILYVPAKVLPALTTIFFLSFTFRNLNSADYVVYSIIAAICLISVQIASNWIANSILYFFPVTRDRWLLLADLAKIGCVAAVLGVCFGGFIIFTQNGKYSSLIVGGFFIVAQIAFYTFSAVCQSVRHISTQLQATFIQCISQLVGLALLSQIGVVSIETCLFVQALGFVFASIHYFFNLRATLGCEIGNKGAFLEDKIQPSIIDILRYGMPIAAWIVATMAMNSTDRFLLKTFSNLTLAASYLSTKDLLVGASGFITMPLLMASHSAILTALHEGRRADAAQIISGNMRILLTVFAVSTALLFYDGPIVLKLMFGGKYGGDSLTLVIVFIGILFSCISMYAQKGLEAASKTGRMAIHAIIAAFVTFGVSWILIPGYGVLGAAISFTVGTFFYLITLVILPARYNTFFVCAIDIAMPAILVVIAFFIENLASILTPGMPMLTGRIVWTALFLTSAGIICYQKYRR